MNSSTIGALRYANAGLLDLLDHNPEHEPVSSDGGRVPAAFVAAGPGSVDMVIDAGAARPRAEPVTRESLSKLNISHDRSRRDDAQELADFAQLELVSGNPSNALDHADRALGLLSDDPPTSELRLSALLTRAGAFEAMGDIDSAIVGLEEVVSDPLPSPLWLRFAIALNRCYRECADFAKAIALGEDVREAVVQLGLAGTDEEVQLEIAIGAAYVGQGDYVEAQRIFDRAIELSDAGASQIAKSSAYWNAGLVADIAGHADRAVELVSHAIALLEDADDGRSLGRLRSTLAYLMLRQEPPDAAGALATLERVGRDLAWSGTSDHDVAGYLEMRARAHYLLGHRDAARESLRQSEALAPSEDPLMQASLAVLRCRLALADATPAGEGQVNRSPGGLGNAHDELLSAARWHLDDAVSSLMRIGRDSKAGHIWFELGSLFAELGAAEESADAFWRASEYAGLRRKSRTLANDDLPGDTSNPGSGKSARTRAATRREGVAISTLQQIAAQRLLLDLSELRAVLEAAAHGISQVEIARHLGRSQPTVHRLLARARNTPDLNARTPREVIAEAVAGISDREAMMHELRSMDLTPGTYADNANEEGFVPGLWTAVVEAWEDRWLTDEEYDALLNR